MRSIVLETFLVVAVLGVVALWRFTPPPRALIAARSPPVLVHVHGDKTMALVTLSPGHAGSMSASIVVMTGEGAPLAAKDVTLTLARPDAGLDRIRRAARLASDGTWQIDELVVPLPGAWSAQVEIVVSDFEKARLEATVEIRP